MADRQLTAKEYADKHGLGIKQVTRMLKKGQIPGAYQLVPRGKWHIPIALTAEEIVIEEERKQAVLAHFEELRVAASQWKSELWLPPPWHWDIADLQHVFYIDRKNQKTGYKSPSALVDGEESKGHFRCFREGYVYWMVQEDGSVILKLPVEDQAALGYLNAHTQESPAWGLFTQWKQRGGTYIQLCSSLLARIDQDAKKAIGAKSELTGWTIYHDVFCIRDTKCRCEKCGTENAAGSRFCQHCNLPLGWLRPLVERYERATDHPQLSPIHIPGWGNIEESVEKERFEGITRGHAALVNKYRGHDLVENILGIEKEVKEIGTQLNQAVESLSQQKVFSGSCEACPL